MNTLVTLQFKGTAYHGFQVQANTEKTICQEVQNALQKVYGTRPDVIGVSRTDTGVHALGYCLNFSVENAMPPIKLPLALNAHLPEDIRAVQAVAVPAGFHARYHANGKEYLYRVYNSYNQSPFEDEYSWRVPGAIDLAAMQHAAAVLVGKHDFSSFMSKGAKVGTQGPVRTVTALEASQEGPLYTIRISADGYLYNMVRIIAGTLVGIGKGEIAQGAMPEILAGKDRNLAGHTAPAKGLFLTKVFYDEGALNAWGGEIPPQSEDVVLSEDAFILQEKKFIV